ncbi:unnamed protein product [Discula destructiva]
MAGPPCIAPPSSTYWTALACYSTQVQTSTGRDAWGDTPLHLATTLPNTMMLALLLGKGNAAVMASRYGRTAMHGSVFGRFPDDAAILHDLVAMLRDAGASIDARDFDGMPCIMMLWICKTR